MQYADDNNQQRSCRAVYEIRKPIESVDAATAINYVRYSECRERQVCWPGGICTDVMVAVPAGGLEQRCRHFPLIADSPDSRSIEISHVQHEEMAWTFCICEGSSLLSMPSRSVYQSVYGIQPVPPRCAVIGGAIKLFP
jgi:hypothetical protein